jgi:hypothetical protein
VTALIALSSVLLVGAVIAGYARRAVFHSDNFANRATATLADENVRAVVADRVTDRLVLANAADLTAARPIIASAISGVVGGSAFQSLFHRGALDVHRAVFQRDQDTVTLTLADVGTVAAAALRKLQPGLADELEGEQKTTLVSRHIGSATGDLARLGRDVRIAAYGLAVLALLAAAGALALSPDRRLTASRLGVGVAIGGLVIVIAYTVASAVVLGMLSDPGDRAAAEAVWRAFLGDLRAIGWVLVAAGSIVAAAAASLVRPVHIEAPLHRAWRLLSTEPERPALRVLRALGLVAAGALVIAEPLTALRVAAILAGAYVAYLGVEALLRVVYRPPRTAEPPPRLAPALGRGAVVVVAAVLIAGALGTFLAAGGADEPAVAASGDCNGAAVLCHRALPEVVLPGTHNSMSAPLPGWFSSQQDASIGPQLADGVRGLLIDTHYADRLANGRLRTVIASDAAQRQDGVSPEAVAAAERLRERAGYRGQGVRGMYLCHTFCELGATPLSDGLRDIHDFLVTHPGEVVVVINQDYVTPTDFVQALGSAGLAAYAFTPPAGDDWPTLGEMIERDQRLVVLAENHAGAAPWYQLVYDRLTKETPFSFRSAAQLTAADLAPSCRENRGPERAPLFLVNHWVTTDPLPRPSNAAAVNAYEPLLRRARACQRERGQEPNLLAVDFYRRGDLFRVVRTLNGL